MRYQEDEHHWMAEKQELTNKVQELFISIDKVRRDAQSQIGIYKVKYSDYK